MGQHPEEYINRIEKLTGLPENFRPLHGLRHAYASMLALPGKLICISTNLTL